MNFYVLKAKEKVLKTEVFRTFCGVDKRDRTANLLNAMSFRRGQNGFICTKQHKIA